MLGAFLKAGINKFEISIKFCVFLIPILIFFKKFFFLYIIALFVILKYKCEKNCTFSNILQKVKCYFFANIYHSPCDSYWNSKKSIKLKPPNVQVQSSQVGRLMITCSQTRQIKKCSACSAQWSWILKAKCLLKITSYLIGYLHIHGIPFSLLLLAAYSIKPKQ